MTRALHKELSAYLTLRRALGYSLARPEKLLNQFLSYLDDAGTDVVTVQSALDWAQLPAGGGSSWWGYRLSAVRGFATYLHGLDPVHEVPAAELFPQRSQRAVPYLYSDADIAGSSPRADRSAARRSVRLKPWPFTLRNCSTRSSVSAQRRWTRLPSGGTCSTTTRPSCRTPGAHDGTRVAWELSTRPSSVRPPLRRAARHRLRIRESDLPTLGLDRSDLVSPDFSSCQRVGAHAAFLEYDALIVPSARADGTNVVIFVNELAADAAFERVGSEEIT